MRRSFAATSLALATLVVPAVVVAQGAAGDPSGDAAPSSDDEVSSENEDREAPAPGHPSFEAVVRSRRPSARDGTRDDVAVDGQRLRDSPRPGMLEALSQESAGVYVPGRGALHGVASGATGGIHIRGLGGSPNSQVLVVEDGAPDYMGVFGHPIPDAYVPFLLEDALIIKGGDSVLFGTNAMGGVVVLRNRWRETDGFEFENDAAYGSYSTLRETASVLGRVGDLDLAAAFHALSTDGHRHGAGGDLAVGHVAARYHLGPDLSLSVRDKAVRLTGGDPGPVTHPHDDHWFDVWRNNASMRLEWNRRPLRLTVTPFLNLGVHRLYDGFCSRDYVAGGITEIDLELHRAVGLILGLAAQHVDGLVENRVAGERLAVRGLTDLSAFGQLAVRPVESLTLVAGARLLSSMTYGPVFLYKGGIRWELPLGLFAHASVARNFRQPTIRELHLPFPTANPELRPEHSRNWDVGLGYEARHLELSAVGYRTEAHDMIRYFGAWPTAQVVNIDHLVIHGVEGRVGLRHLGPLSLYVGGDWRDVGRYTRQNPEARLTFNLEAGHEFGRHFVGGGLGGEWVHGLYMANYGREPIDDVFFMDLALRYRHTSADGRMRLEPYLFLRNLQNRDYAYVEGYPMPGFNVLLGLKVGI